MAVFGVLIALLVAGCGGGFEIAVQNDSAMGFVAGGDGGNGILQYFPVPPGTTVVVDTTGHVNPPMDPVHLFDASCSPVRSVKAGFDEGATIVIKADASTESHSPRRAAKGTFGPGWASCAEAAAQL